MIKQGTDGKGKARAGAVQISKAGCVAKQLMNEWVLEDWSV
jgi:hypothetical protein